jgi:ppGpp synthetase/RelA/SpoT-type nucleotidyltranferase
MRLQEIQRRAKDVDSLRKKIAKLTNPPTDVALAVKDLGGCRLVFYTNADVSVFLNASIIHDNFEVDWDRTKIHHPTRDEPSSGELFHSHNYVVRLKEPRVDLPEHEHLRGLWCEVQVQTTLNHAWSEMAHDTIYKKPELNGFGALLMKSIDERMTNIMRDYLLPAGFEFQKVVADFERLSAGKELFDSKPLLALKQSTDNNERYEILSRFLDTVLPHYDDIDGAQSEIRNAMVDVVLVSRGCVPKAIETPYGTLPGKSAEDVTRRALEVIDRLRYLGEDATRLTWRSLCAIFPSASSDLERNRILDSVHGLAKNNLRVWEVAGPVVQEVLTQELEALSINERLTLRPVVIKAIAAMQDLEAESSSFEGDTWTLSRCVVPHSPELESIRARCFSVLRAMLLASNTDPEKREVISCLRRGGHLARQEAPEATVAMAIRDTAQVTDLLAEMASELSFELRQEIEHDALWDFRRYVSTDPHEPACANAAACEAIKSSLQRLRAALNHDEEFQIFKVLVGYNSVFEPAWDDPEFEVERFDEHRKRERRAIIARIDPGDTAKWRKTLLRCASTDATDLATLPPFHIFMRELGEARPDMALAFIREEEPRWKRFLPDLLIGVGASGRSAHLHSILSAWVNAGSNLEAVVQYLEASDAVDIELLSRATRKAIAKADAVGVLSAVSAINKHHRQARGDLWALFLDAVSYLAGEGDERWIRCLRPIKREESILKDLSEADASSILNQLSAFQRLDLKAESLLAVIAADWPRLVVDYLAQRVRNGIGKSRSDFESLPLRFHLLQKILPSESEYLLTAGRALYKEDQTLFTYRGALLVSNVFPKYVRELNDALARLLEVTGSDDDLQYVALLLGKFKSDPAIYGMCMEIVAKTDAEEVLSEVRSSMTSFGVVGGEYGHANATQRVRDGIQPWLEDARPRVKAFAKSFAHRLEQSVASERRSAQLRHEQRKRS